MSNLVEVGKLAEYAVVDTNNKTFYYLYLVENLQREANNSTNWLKENRLCVAGEQAAHYRYRTIEEDKTEKQTSNSG